MADGAGEAASVAMFSIERAEFDRLQVCTTLSHSRGAKLNALALFYSLVQYTLLSMTCQL